MIAAKRPTLQKPVALVERIQAAETAYLALPAKLAKGREAALLAQVKAALPHLRIGVFHTEFEDDVDWRENFASYIEDVDAFIVGCDSSREIQSGLVWELWKARQRGKLIFLFKFDDNEPRRYFGYDQIGEKPRAYKLRKRADVHPGERGEKAQNGTDKKSAKAAPPASP